VLKGHDDEVKTNPVVFFFFPVQLGMLIMLPITYSKYSDRKNLHLISSSDNRISGNAFFVVLNRRLKIALFFTIMFN